MQMETNRFIWIDWLKVIAMFLVVLGHARGGSAIISAWIFSFHIPLFFAISGFLLPIKLSTLSWKNVVMVRSRKLLFSYLLFGIIGVLFWGMFAQFSQTVHMPLSTVLINASGSLLYGSGTVDLPLQLFPVVLWFFPALILGQFLIYGVVILPSRVRIPAILACAVSAYLMKTLILPWEAESALAAVPFLFVGYALRCSVRWQQSLSAVTPSVIVIFFLLGAMVGIKYGFRDFRTSSFGNPLLACFSCGMTILSLAAIAMKLPRLQSVTHMANASIVIFSMHMLVFIIIDSIVKRFPGVPLELITKSALYAFLKSVASFLILVAVFPVFRRLFPFLGQSNLQRQSSSEIVPA
jgi:acyltransferase